MAVRWYSMSTQFLADPKIETLGEQFGAAGPLVIVALLGRAKIEADAGRVTCSFRTLAHEAFADRGEIADILRGADETGLLEIEELNESDATVRFPAFVRWQEAGRKASEREARKPSGEANVRTRPEASAGVPTRQDKTEKTGQDKRRDNKGSDKSDFDSWLTHYREVTGRTSVTGSKPAREAFTARRKEGRSLEDLKAATVGCHGDTFCRENGHDVPETILRASKVERYIALAKQPASTGSPGMDNARRRADRIRARQAA